MRVPEQQGSVSRMRERRFRTLVLNAPVAVAALATFEEWLHSPEGPCEARARRLKHDEMIRSIVECVRAQLHKRGVPTGFHCQALTLQNRRSGAAAHEGRPPLVCGQCRGPIDPFFDFACDLKRPACKRCAIAQGA